MTLNLRLFFSLLTYINATLKNCIYLLNDQFNNQNNLFIYLFTHIPTLK